MDKDKVKQWLEILISSAPSAKAGKPATLKPLEELMNNGVSFLSQEGILYDALLKTLQEDKEHAGRRQRYAGAMLARPDVARRFLARNFALIFTEPKQTFSPMGNHYNSMAVYLPILLGAANADINDFLGQLFEHYRTLEEEQKLEFMQGIATVFSGENLTKILSVTESKDFLAAIRKQFDYPEWNINEKNNFRLLLLKGLSQQPISSLNVVEGQDERLSGILTTLENTKDKNAQVTMKALLRGFFPEIEKDVVFNAQNIDNQEAHQHNIRVNAGKVIQALYTQINKEEWSFRYHKVLGLISDLLRSPKIALDYGTRSSEPLLSILSAPEFLVFLKKCQDMGKDITPICRKLLLPALFDKLTTENRSADILFIFDNCGIDFSKMKIAEASTSGVMQVSFEDGESGENAKNFRRLEEGQYNNVVSLKQKYDELRPASSLLDKIMNSVTGRKGSDTGNSVYTSTNDDKIAKTDAKEIGWGEWFWNGIKALGRGIAYPFVSAWEGIKAAASWIASNVGGDAKVADYDKLPSQDSTTRGSRKNRSSSQSTAIIGESLEETPLHQFFQAASPEVLSQIFYQLYLNSFETDSALKKIGKSSIAERSKGDNPLTDYHAAPSDEQKTTVLDKLSATEARDVYLAVSQRTLKKTTLSSFFNDLYGNVDVEKLRSIREALEKFGSSTINSAEVIQKFDELDNKMKLAECEDTASEYSLGSYLSTPGLSASDKIGGVSLTDAEEYLISIDNPPPHILQTSPSKGMENFLLSMGRAEKAYGVYKQALNMAPPIDIFKKYEPLSGAVVGKIYEGIKKLKMENLDEMIEIAMLFRPDLSIQSKAEACRYFMSRACRSSNKQDLLNGFILDCKNISPDWQQEKKQIRKELKQLIETDKTSKQEMHEATSDALFFTGTADKTGLDKEWEALKKAFDKAINAADAAAVSLDDAASIHSGLST